MLNETELIGQTDSLLIRFVVHPLVAIRCFFKGHPWIKTPMSSVATIEHGLHHCQACGKVRFGSPW